MFVWVGVVWPGLVLPIYYNGFNKRPRDLYALLDLLPDETNIALRIMAM